MKMRKKLKFICIDNVNSMYPDSQMLMVYDDGSFDMLADTPSGDFIFIDTRRYGVKDREGWESRGWRTVIEL